MRGAKACKAGEPSPSCSAGNEARNWGLLRMRKGKEKIRGGGRWGAEDGLEIQLPRGAGTLRTKHLMFSSKLFALV